MYNIAALIHQIWRRYEHFYEIFFGHIDGVDTSGWYG
jgi:hypothetical protein